MTIKAKSRASAQTIDPLPEPGRGRNVASWVEAVAVSLAGLWASTMPWGEAEAHHAPARPHPTQRPGHHGRNADPLVAAAPAAEQADRADRPSSASAQPTPVATHASDAQAALSPDAPAVAVDLNGGPQPGNMAIDVGDVALAGRFAATGHAALNQVSHGAAAADPSAPSAETPKAEAPKPGATPPAPSDPVPDDESTLSVLDLDAAGVVAAVDRVITSAPVTHTAFHDLAVGDILNETVLAALRSGEDPIVALHQLGPEFTVAAEKLMADPQSHLSHLIDTLAPTEGHTTAEDLAALTAADPAPEPAHPLSDTPLFT